MKTTLELPDELMRRVKMHALLRSQKLKDAVAQLLIYGQVHPGAALVVGPVLIGIPYAVARALTNRVARLTQRDSGK